MNKISKRIAKCIAFVLIILLLLGIATDIMTCNDMISQLTLEQLNLEEKNSLDATVIGASEVFAGFSPTTAWENYGYTSFALGLSGASCKVYRTLVDELSRRQKPKVLAIELNGFIHKDEYSDSIAKLRNVYDNIPWSMNRIRSIQNFVPDKEKINFYFPLASYHSLWTSKERIKRHMRNRIRIARTGYGYLKGTSTYSYAYDMGSIKQSGKIYFTKQNKKLLTDLLDDLKEKGYENVVFFKAPTGSVPKDSTKLTEIYELIESYGYDILDCSGDNMEQNGINIHTDFYNRDHMNVYGMEKFTKYLSEYFVTNYDLKGQHTDEQKARWDLCAKKCDELFAACKQNIADNKVIHYKETAFYVEPKPFKNPYKALGLKEPKK